LFAGINDLPKDDPLRTAADAPSESGGMPHSTDGSIVRRARPELAEGVGSDVADAAPAQQPDKIEAIPAGMVAAPQLVGKPLRAAMETLMSDGLRLQAEGSGLARSQSPASGTPMAPGAVVLVRFSR